MSPARIFRYILGVIVGAILLAILLPFFGVPRSHYLPPAWVYPKAQGVTRGYITGKFYDVTNNPFNVGGKQWHVNYQFRAKALGPRGEPGLGQPQVYYGTILVDNSTYDKVALGEDKNTADKAIPGTLIPAAPGQAVRVRYEKTYPDINGIEAPWGSRSVGPGSNNLSGWIIWSIVALILGYFIMLLFERFSHTENI